MKKNKNNGGKTEMTKIDLQRITDKSSYWADWLDDLGYRIELVGTGTIITLGTYSVITYRPFALVWGIYIWSACSLFAHIYHRYRTEKRFRLKKS